MRKLPIGQNFYSIKTIKQNETQKVFILFKIFEKMKNKWNIIVVVLSVLAVVVFDFQVFVCYDKQSNKILDELAKNLPNLFNFVAIELLITY
jgi:hypothetical protein